MKRQGYRANCCPVIFLRLLFVITFTKNRYSMFDPIEAAIKEIRHGKIVIVVDDEDRENEGDFIAAAATITPEIVNFMTKHGRGLVCVPLPAEHCDELGLELMVSNNTALHETAFTVSVDLLGHGCTTGISAHDRAKTIQALIDPFINPKDLGRPGHIFPLRAKKGGVLRRAGHTEAAVDLARLAGFPAPYGGVLVEIMNDDGTMARLPELLEVGRPELHPGPRPAVVEHGPVAHRVEPAEQGSPARGAGQAPLSCGGE